MAVDKQTIMEKLFAEKPLTNEEILHIGSRLDEEPVVASTGKAKKKKAIPFDHKDTIPFSDACGLKEEDFKHINKLIKSEVMDKDKELALDSMIVEVYEKISLAKPQNLRLVMYQFVKMRKMLQKNSTSGIRLDNGGSGGLDDFLNFLKGRM